MKFFNLSRGFGFITADSGEDVYFNSASLPRDRRFDPVEGDRVMFETRDTKQGLLAHRIEMTQ